MAEEHRQQQAQRLCVNNCGFFGSPATQNLCSKCSHHLQLNDQQMQSSNAKHALKQTLHDAFASSPSVSASSSSSSPTAIEIHPVTLKKSKETVRLAVAPQQPNRCMTCRRRVGLTGFKCRCEMVFCGTHRYPEQHDCGFNYKSVGREQIAQANPVVKADKLEKI